MAFSLAEPVRKGWGCCTPMLATGFQSHHSFLKDVRSRSCQCPKITVQHMFYLGYFLALEVTDTIQIIIEISLFILCISLSQLYIP